MTTVPTGAHLDRHRALGAHLSGLDDAALLALMAASRGHRRGIGGATAQVDVHGVPVFIKRIAVTALELQPGHRSSTANVSELPAYCHYGIGSAGPGVWREVAALTMASQWARSSQEAPFPLLHHWRLLPGGAGIAGDGEAHDYLAHPAAVAADDRVLRRRLEGLRASCVHVALFMECLPATLSTWLAGQWQASPDSLPETVRWVERESAAAFAFMRRQGFVHFDAHLDNVLTDGRRLYFADHGLAMAAAFDLDAAERRFLARHAGYDAARFSASLTHVLCRAVPGDDDWRDKVARARREPAATAVAAALHRHAPAALYMADFARRLIDVDRHTPFTPPPAATAS